ncbi:putative nucleotidyltransferase, ribonuclease H, partial [Tanacetum coccineum]
MIWYGNRLCVPDDSSLREAIFTKAHSSPFSIHPGSTKMYRDLKQKFWWNGMKQEVARFMAKCLTCQQVKIEHQRASGLLQPLDIPTWKWDQISMDFVTRLPRTFKKNDAIWVVVDQLTKSAHFFPIQQGFSSSKLAEIFQQEIIRLQGTHASIVSDRDPRFASRFWKGLQNAWGTKLKFSTAFHPQTDGQTERTIQTLEDMLRSCALEWTGNWDEYLCLVEFAYNNSWHASIKGAPFELLYGRKCRAPICWNEVGERVIEGPELVEVTNEKVAIAKEKLKEARSRQKSYVNRHRRALDFKLGDRVFLKVSPCRGVRRFGLKGKLSPRFIGLFEILDRVGEVSYRLALSPQLSHVQNVFHVSLLRGYNYHPYHVVQYPFDKIREDLSFAEEPKTVLDRQERVMRNKTIPLVKVLWKNHPPREATCSTAFLLSAADGSSSQLCEQRSRSCFTAAVAQAIADLLPTLITRITDEIRQNKNNENNANRRNARRVNTRGSGNDGDAQPTDIHVWLERFQKQKPQTFSSASTPVEAENWIAYIEKIFEVLGCGDQFKARLVTYKLEGDAHSWWRAYKQAKGGDAYV